MTQFGPVSAWLLVGGSNVTGDIYDMGETREQVLEECRPFSGGAIEDWDAYKGVGIGKIGLETGQGVYDTRTAGQLEAFQGAGTTRQLVDYGFAGCADPVGNVGNPLTMVDGTYAVKWARKAQRANITMGQASHAVTGVPYEGLVVAGLVARSGNGTTEASYLDYGAGSYGHAIFDIQVTALSLGGGSNVVVTIHSSPDHSAWNLEATSAAITVASTAQRILVTSTIDRYLKATWTFTGGAAQTCTLMVGAYLYT